VNLLDVVIVSLCLVFAVYGIFQGIVRQLFSWSGLILGHLAGVRYYETAQEKLRLDFPHSDVAAYLLLFVAVYLLFRLLGLLVERSVRGSELSGADRFAGMLAGLVKGALLAVLLVFVLVILLPRDTALLRESTLAPTAMVAAGWVQKIFPERIGSAFREKAGELASSFAGKMGSPPSPQPKKRSKK